MSRGDVTAICGILFLLAFSIVCAAGIAVRDRPPRPLSPRIEPVRHAGHDYLRFFDLGGVSVVHDPECECHAN